MERLNTVDIPPSWLYGYIRHSSKIHRKNRVPETWPLICRVFWLVYVMENSMNIFIKMDDIHGVAPCQETPQKTWGLLMGRKNVPENKRSVDEMKIAMSCYR